MYVSNETPNIPVYFDNLQVSHIRSPLLETNEYYPYGLKMANISYKASMTMTNRYGWNGGNEYEDEGELNYSNTFYRKYDAQIGRFTGVDIRAEEAAFINPYQFGYNNPIMFSDPDGDLSQAVWNDFLSRINTMDFGNYGGSYSGNSGFNAFRSDAESFSAGASYMDKHNAWGTNGFASSFEGAKDSYYAHGGTDARIRSLYPNITIYGGIKNGQWQTRNTLYSGFGGGGYGSADDAARAWTSQYGKWSIVNAQEVSSLIYEKGGQFFYTPGMSFKTGSASSSPGPKMLIPIHANLLKGLNTVGFIHSHGAYQQPADLRFSTWSPGWDPDKDYDIYGHQDQRPKRGIAENYPNLIMYLSSPIGNLLRRDSENKTLNGFSYLIGSGYYCDPKFKK